MEGRADAAAVLEFFADRRVDQFYCSPFRRSVDTIRAAADYFNKEIKLDERLRKREHGAGGNNREMFRKRCENHDFHEENGESLAMVRQRNIDALNEILRDNAGLNIVVGTHGTALRCIINFFKPEFGCDDFLRIIDRMPYILEMDFDGLRLVSMAERLYVEKKFE